LLHGPVHRIINRNEIESVLISLRGGASKSKRGRRTSRTASLSSSEKKTATGKKKVGAALEKTTKESGGLWSKYKKIAPLTRLHLTSVVVCTLLGLVLGEELTHGLMSLNPLRVTYGLELWRPFTAATYLGPPSLGLVFSFYYLLNYGSLLEKAYGTPQYLVFLLTQLLSLSVLSSLFGQPFFATGMTTAMLHVLSRATPKQSTKWLIFNVPMWILPYAMMLSDVLQAKSIAPVLPHILGILSGHVYFFHKFVWPKIGGEDWLTAPDFLVQRLDPDAKPAKEKISNALKRRKRGKGRKLST